MTKVLSLIDQKKTIMKEGDFFFYIQNSIQISSIQQTFVEPYCYQTLFSTGNLEMSKVPVFKKLKVYRNRPNGGEDVK